MMLKVIDGHKAEHEAKKPPVSWYLDRYAGMAMRKMVAVDNGDTEQLPSAVLCAVRHFNYARLCGTSTGTLFHLAMYIEDFFGMLTPNQLLQTFPPAKTYDGAKWGNVDYYSTMVKFEDLLMDVPIRESGEDINELLWGYDNHDLMIFNVNLMCVVSELHKLKTGRDMLDDFMENQGKPPLNKYHLQTDSNGKQYMVDEQGRSFKIRKAKPRYLKVIEGKRGINHDHND